MKILFHHIPKTAGTSLITRASDLFAGQVCEGRYDDQVREKDILDERLAFYHGHFTRGFVMNFRRLVPDAKIVTFLRHPYNRTLSQYYNWTDAARVRRELGLIAGRSGDSRSLRLLLAKFERRIFAMSLEQFLRSKDPHVLQASDNLQSQYMTAKGSAPPHVRFNAATCEAISFYDFIGIQELYAPCLRILEAVCRLAPGALGGSERENNSDYAKTDGRYHVTASELALLERRNIYDLALYHSCYALLLKQHGAWLPAGACDVNEVVQLPAVIGEVRGGTNGRAGSDGVAPFTRPAPC